ncbi:HNH endonuclease [Bacillus sp. S34]|nr:HNH endonuclease [Bacillus sp. S34]
MIQSIEDRFMAKTQRTGSCLIWTSSIDSEGYGRFFLDGKKRRAHRVSYQMHKGPIPDDKVIDHICRNKRCVEPSHLRANE